MKTIFLFVALLLSIQGFSQKENQFPFRNGDLLFQDLDCGELCDAIEAVTPGLGDKHFSHIGMVYIAADSVYVIEALGKAVKLTRIQDFLNRQLNAGKKPKVVVGRLKEPYQRLNGRALGFALEQRGKPYDDAFIYNNGKYYCSELVYDAYKEANHGEPFFHLYPMTFKDPQTGKTFPAWKEYYKILKTKVPEGKPGCNPGSIAISNNVEIVHSFY